MNSERHEGTENSGEGYIKTKEKGRWMDDRKTGQKKIKKIMFKQSTGSINRLRKGLQKRLKVTENKRNKQEKLKKRWTGDRITGQRDYRPQEV